LPASGPIAIKRAGRTKRAARKGLPSSTQETARRWHFIHHFPRNSERSYLCRVTLLRGRVGQEEAAVKVSVSRLALAICVFFAAPSLAFAETVSVVLDQARILKLPEKVATIVIGNPQVADGSLQSGGLLVVTGKGYGSTNIIALDNRGSVLAEHTVRVGASKEGLTVWRGVNRETWSCAPRCERSVMLGDANDFFEGTLKQSESRNNFSAPAPGSASSSK
jgi:hypothetical protein